MSRLTAPEYFAQITARLQALLDWRERWDRRSPEEEPELKREWERLSNRSEALIATPVEGEDR